MSSPSTSPGLINNGIKGIDYKLIPFKLKKPNYNTNTSPRVVSAFSGGSKQLKPPGFPQYILASASDPVSIAHQQLKIQHNFNKACSNLTSSLKAKIVGGRKRRRRRTRRRKKKHTYRKKPIRRKKSRKNKR